MSVDVFNELISWSKNQYSKLPWRTKRTLYKTLVSEIMLQQTTVGTVLNHFDRFLEEYPTIEKLAQASEEQVCISWKGLGYYRRARNLRNLAIQIVENFEGKVPTNLESLMGLKGIGPYTANALLSIGADKEALAVDANLERVLARFYAVEELKGPKLQKKIWNEFEKGKILPEMKSLSPRALNEALMDLGRIVCQAKKATCMICPLRSECQAYKKGIPLHFPIETGEKKPSAEFSLELLRVIVKKKNQRMVYQKHESEWLSGQWELPTFILNCDDTKLKQYPRLEIEFDYKELHSIKTSITKYAIKNYYVEMDEKEFKKLSKGMKSDYQFKTYDESLNLSTASLKILKKL